MLAVDVGVDVLGADVELLSQHRLEPGGFKHSAGADDELRRVAGNLVEHVIHHVHGVGEDAVDVEGGLVQLQ